MKKTLFAALLASVFVLQPAYAAKGGASAYCQKKGKLNGIAAEIALKYENSKADTDNSIAEFVRLAEKRMPKDVDKLLGGEGSDSYNAFVIHTIYMSGSASIIKAKSKLKNPSRKQIIDYAIKDGISDCMKLKLSN